MKKRKQKIAVAYSGGLDTSVMIKWLQENYDAEIIAVTGNLGEVKNLAEIKSKAIKTGAKKSYVIDLRDKFATSYIFPSLQAGALYEGAYPMATALGRPLLAKSLVDIAKKEQCTAVAHGCTGKGNDQVRFELAIAALNPSLTVLAPLRSWEFKSREDEILYCEKHNIPVTATKKNPYSIDENMWGTSIECGVLEDATIPPPEDAFQTTLSPENSSNVPDTISIQFREGIPIKLNNKPSTPTNLITTLNKIAAKHGIGRLDFVENRMIGIKSREIYEAPAATVLHFAHTELERLTLDKDTARYKQKISIDYADIIYNGGWFSPLRTALDAFISKTQETVNGTLSLELFKGNIRILSRYSKNSLYDKNLATYTSKDSFDHSASKGFIQVLSLPYKTYYKANKKSQKKLGNGPN